MSPFAFDSDLLDVVAARSVVSGKHPPILVKLDGSITDSGDQVGRRVPEMEKIWFPGSANPVVHRTPLGYRFFTPLRRLRR